MELMILALLIAAGMLSLLAGVSQKDGVSITDGTDMDGITGQFSTADGVTVVAAGGGGAGATVTEVKGGTALSGDPITITGVTTAAVGTVVIALGWEDGTMTLSGATLDSVSATGIIQQRDAIDRATTAIVYWLNKSAVSNVSLVLDFSASVGYMNYQIYLISGWTATPEVLAGSDIQTGTDTAVATDAVATTVTDSVRIASVGNVYGKIYSAPKFGTDVATGPLPDGNYYSSWYRVYTGTGNLTANITQDTAGDWAAVTAAFQARS